MQIIISRILWFLYDILFFFMQKLNCNYFCTSIYRNVIKQYFIYQWFLEQQISNHEWIWIYKITKYLYTLFIPSQKIN